MTIRSTLAIAAFAAAAFMPFAAAQAAITTFATYQTDDSIANLRWQKAGTSGGSLFTIDTPTATTAASSLVKFSFLTPVLAAFGPLQATYSLLATVPDGNPANSGFGFIVQGDLSGGFSFRYAGASPLVVGDRTYLTGANLLSATFTNASIAGAVGSSSGNVSASTTGTDDSTVVFTSDFLNFAGITNEGFAINMTSIQPGLAQSSASASLRSFRTSSGGSFAADPSPPVVAVVPEPSTWAMMAAGFGLAGFGLRRRKSRGVATVTA